MDIVVLAPGADLVISRFVIATEIKGVVNLEQKYKLSHANRNFNHNLRNKPEHRTNVLNRHGYFHEDSNTINRPPNFIARKDPSSISNSFLGKMQELVNNMKCMVESQKQPMYIQATNQPHKFRPYPDPSNKVFQSVVQQ